MAVVSTVFVNVQVSKLITSGYRRRIAAAP